ncbi:tetratricopeptide repeat protein [soil metagenome]
MSDESLFREVDEEVRQDQIKKIWQRHGGLISTAALIIVIAVAAFQGWKYWQLRQSEASAQTYADGIALISDGKAPEGEALLQTITHSGYSTLAKLRRAAALNAEGKTDDAVAAYDAVAADPNTDPALQDLAKIRAGYILADKVTPAELIKRLGTFDKEDSRWRSAAREIFALSAYRTADYSMADRYLNAIIADREAPGSLRQRAQMLAQLVAPLLPEKSTTQ